MIKTNRLRLMFYYVGAKNWYEGCEKVSFLDWLYKRRIGFETAYDLALLVYPKKDSNATR